MKIPFQKNIWVASTFVLLGICILMASVNISGKVIEKDIISKAEAREKALDFINNYLLQGMATANITNVTEEYGLYKLIVNVNGRNVPTYMTKDGKILFPNALDIEEVKQQIKAMREQVREEEQNIPKREKVNVKFFVMSFCPFGNQAENALAPVFKLLGERNVEWEPHYVIYSNYGGYPDYCLDKEEKYCSMHGIQELHQDIRELCVWKYYNHSVWWDFVLKINDKCNSRNVDSCWQDIAREVGIDVVKIETCQKNEAVDLLQHEVELNQQYGVTGSPTVFINDVEYRGSRTPEAYKQAICSGFYEAPNECNETLNSTSSYTQGKC